MSINQTKKLLEQFYNTNKSMIGGTNKILNPATGRFVKRDGVIGKRIISMKETIYVDNVLKKNNKVSSKKRKQSKKRKRSYKN